MWARGEKLPSRIFSSMMTCPCGVAFDSHDPEGSYVHRGHMTLNETLTHREANAKGYASETALAQNRLQVPPVPLFRVAKLPPTFFDEGFCQRSNADPASIF
jgi:hypothetical protein